MRVVDAAYRRFLEMLRARPVPMNVDKLARAMFGVRPATARELAAYRPRKGASAEALTLAKGRAALTQVLLGKRPGSRTWRKLEGFLTVAEYRLVREYARGKYAALVAAGGAHRSTFLYARHAQERAARVSKPPNELRQAA